MPMLMMKGEEYCEEDVNVDYVMESLKSIRKQTIEICETVSHSVTAPTVEQKRILQLLGVTM